VFISGQGYAATFTTRSSIVDAISGESIVDDLESWPVTRDGAAFKEIDFNFWGVTFTRDGKRFYATLGTGGHTYLVQGDFASRQMHVVADGVECPSLSPDGKRIGFKRRDPAGDGGRLHWHVAVLDLESGQVRVLPGEARSVDDQVEWNGNGELLYAMPVEAGQSSAEMDVWAIAADGDAPARRLARFAFSPAVVR
jgi:Tol biopolymer transport system component